MHLREQLRDASTHHKPSHAELSTGFITAPRSKRIRCIESIPSSGSVIRKDVYEAAARHPFNNHSTGTALPKVVAVVNWVYATFK